MRPRFRYGVSALVIVTFTFACGSLKYANLIEANRGNVQKMRVGMSREEAVAMLGGSEVHKFGNVHVQNPWRSEGFRLKEEETTVEILYYLTEHQKRWNKARDDELTPVVLENEILVGWGWSYLRRNLDRYGISIPLEQD